MDLQYKNVHICIQMVYFDLFFKQKQPYITY
jgi:hypothetical protein